jgi:uracil-DNA glycosylase family 4
MQELAALSPKLVICLGETAAKVMFGNIAIGQARGKIRFTGEYLVGSSYHPAATFRQPELYEVIVEDVKGYLSEI